MATIDRRSLRTQQALRSALAEEIHEVGDLSKITVTGVTRRANVTRRTFYSHYRDIPCLVCAVEDQTIAELAPLVRDISNVTLPELEQTLQRFNPCPGSIELLAYFRANGQLLSALLGEGGDPAFVEKLKHMVGEVVEDRAREGFSELVEAGFDYYLTYAISAEVGVLVRWLTTGMTESDDLMARIMTTLMFVRPGDLYGRPIQLNVPILSASFAEKGKEPIHG
ncbi:MAG: TetR-like C-terminal domain-containing protein [Coriobacteriales bacterium]|nr:TetR-like C-terminal domain-containing protein [Coriobacteriales bacterium]